MSTFYAAPWDTGLLTTTILTTALCAAIGIFLILYGRRIKRISSPSGSICQSLGILEIGIVIAFALFTVRGYTVTPEKIQVHRLLWKTDLPFGGLQSVEAEPNAMRGSKRTAGNGGFFAYSGQWKK